MPETGTGCPQLLYTLLTETGSPAEFVPCTFWLASLPGNPVPLLLTVGITHGYHLCLPCIWGSGTDQVLRLVQQVLSFSPQLHDNYFFILYKWNNQKIKYFFRGVRALPELTPWSCCISANGIYSFHLVCWKLVKTMRWLSKWLLSELWHLGLCSVALVIVSVKCVQCEHCCL